MFILNTGALPSELAESGRAFLSFLNPFKSNKSAKAGGGKVDEGDKFIPSIAAGNGLGKALKSEADAGPLNAILAQILQLMIGGIGKGPLEQISKWQTVNELAQSGVQIGEDIALGAKKSELSAGAVNTALGRLKSFIGMGNVQTKTWTDHAKHVYVKAVSFFNDLSGSGGSASS